MSVSAGSTERKPLRVWPGLVIVGLLLAVRFVLPALVPEALGVGIFGGLVAGLLVVLWWLFFSRARWVERLGGVALLVAGFFAARALLDVSIVTAAQGMLYPMVAVPTVAVAFVLAVAATRRAPAGRRWLAMVLAVVVGYGGWALVRTGGVYGGFEWDYAWRWSETAEDRLLAEAGGLPAAGATAVTAAEPGVDWPGFRGRGRDSVVRGTRFATDWEAHPPVEMWRRAVGPGWSSFAAGGGRVFTQEQRGEEEVVAAYDLGTGEPVWMHADPVRFWEAMAGAGPRGTPTLSEGRIYALGATGVFNALDAADGSVVWSRDAGADAEVERPGWGFAGSPLVIGEAVVVAVAGRLLAYDRADGGLLWRAGPTRESYGSPHRATIGGVEQVLLLTGEGVTSVAAEDGSPLWEHAWPGFHSLQPTLTGDGDVLVASSGNAGGFGTRRLAVNRRAETWTVTELWTSKGLKPYFNDSVVHGGHAYGFDGRILACIDLATGERVWKGGRYGNGQVLLLADQDALLVLSERGEIALVAATPDGYTELAHVPALEGKTWNHPAVAGDVLLVRNAEEMAAYRLPSG